MRKPNRQRGLFITLEGGEGSGKSTQAKLLTKWLRKERHMTVLLTREPGGGTEIGEQIHRTVHSQRTVEELTEEYRKSDPVFSRQLRKILLHVESAKLDPIVEALLYSADRKEHVPIVKDSLERGWIVVSDRFHDSTTVYQGYGHGVDLKFIKTLHRHVVEDCLPDLTIYLDVDPEEGLRRARQRNLRRRTSAREGRFEAKRLDFHQRVRDGYLELARQEPNRVRVVDGGSSVETVQERVREIAGSCIRDLTLKEPHRIYKASKLKKSRGR
jgi:dTMP kinase